MDAFQEFKGMLAVQVDTLQARCSATIEIERAENARLRRALTTAHLVCTPREMAAETPRGSKMHPLKWAPCSPRPGGISTAVRNPHVDTATQPRSQQPMILAEGSSVPEAGTLEAVLDWGSSFTNGIHSRSSSSSLGSNALDNWVVIGLALLHNKRKPKVPDSEVLQLRPLWVFRKEDLFASDAFNNRPSTTRFSWDDYLGRNSEMESSYKVNVPRGRGARMGSVILERSTWRQKFVRHPDKCLNLSHAILTSTLIIYDVIMFPLALAFKLDFLGWLAWITTVFWTFDIPFSFVQGFHSHGLIEMRPSQVARHYLQTWFFPDLVIVMIDWFALVGSIVSGQQMAQQGMLRAKPIKAFRFLRAARLLRLFRAAEVMRALASRIAPAEWILVTIRICGLVFLIMLVNHYVACLWYAIGSSGSGITWIKVYNLDDQNLFTQYATALHWSLTQFTPATTDVAPANGRERFFASIVIFFALLLFSNFLSSLTSAAMQIKSMNYERYTSEVAIRDFLHDKHVSLELGNRIWHYYRAHYTIRKQVTHEADIPFFHKIPRSLRLDLYKEIYVPTLARHPLFDFFAEADLQLVATMCTAAVAERTHRPGQELFMEGEQAKHMIFLVAGHMTYECPFYDIPQVIHAPDWISEATLWSKWVHCGRLSSSSAADSECQVLLLHARRFGECIGNHATAGQLRVFRKYAAIFAQAVCDSAEVPVYGAEVRALSSTVSRPSGPSGPGKTLDIKTIPITDIMENRELVHLLANQAFNDDCRRTASRQCGRSSVMNPSPSRSSRISSFGANLADMLSKAGVMRNSLRPITHEVSDTDSLPRIRNSHMSIAPVGSTDTV